MRSRPGPRCVSTVTASTLVLVLTLALAGCFTTTADYRQKAEEFIVEDEGVAELGVFVSATCEEPADQEVGTVFACTAIDDAGGAWGFDVEIADSDRIELTVSDRPPP